MRGALVVALLAAVATLGCPEDETCKTTADCHARGLTDTQCVDGACVQACIADSDCSGNQICEGGLCVEGCGQSSASCDAAEKLCVKGRCAAFFESFEAAHEGDIVTLRTLGWNAIARPLSNARSRVVFFREDCTLEDDEVVCAGPAADGRRFLSIERVPTPAHSTAEFGPTCRACRCCLECRDPTSRTSSAGCGLTYPSVPGGICAASPPTACQSICSTCDACPALPTDVEFGESLSVCENEAGSRICPPCLVWDTCLRTQKAEECLNEQKVCEACREGERLKRESPSEPSLWQPLLDLCENQGNNACVPTPRSYPRSELTEDEQSLESPKIDLSAAGGDMVLELQYVPFDLAPTYVRVIQAKDRDEWPVEPQEVEIQLCGGACENAASWKPAKLVSGDAAKFPPAIQYDNNLRFASQSTADWRADRREVVIPADLRTADFHFRLVPRLGDNVRFGVDAVTVRRQR